MATLKRSTDKYRGLANMPEGLKTHGYMEKGGETQTERESMGFAKNLQGKKWKIYIIWPL